MIVSEVGTESLTIQRMMAWVARNRATQLGRALAELGAPRGQWGRVASDRPFATNHLATAWARALAESILNMPQHRDPSRGATHAFNRDTQDQLAERRPGIRDSQTVMQIWTQHYGLEPITEIGPWTFYR